MPEITGGQITLLDDRACPDVPNLRELGENCVSFWLGFVLGVLRFSDVFWVLAENGFQGRMCLK